MDEEIVRIMSDKPVDTHTYSGVGMFFEHLGHVTHELSQEAAEMVNAVSKATIDTLNRRENIVAKVEEVGHDLLAKPLAAAEKFIQSLNQGPHR